MINYSGYMINHNLGGLNAQDIEIGRKIENALIVKGWNVRQLSEETGISYPTLRRSLKGGRSFSFREFCSITHFLGVEPEDILNGTLTNRSAA